MAGIDYIKLSKISIPEFDGRLEIDTDSDHELADSIKEMGVLEPLIVRKVNGKIVIIAGSCRYRASKIAGLDAVPCIVVKADDQYSEQIKLHENLKRSQLSHVDQAMTFARLRSEFNMTESEISQLSGKSIPYISQHINLLNADDTLITAVQSKSIKFSVARELMHVKNIETQKHLLGYAIKGGASVEIVRNWVQEARYEEERSEPVNTSQTLQPPTQTRPMTLFKCQTCESDSKIIEMCVLRVCPECNDLIFTVVREAKKEATPQIAPEAS